MNPHNAARNKNYAHNALTRTIREEADGPADSAGQSFLIVHPYVLGNRSLWNAYYISYSAGQNRGSLINNYNFITFKP